VVGSWQGGFQGDVTVKNTGTATVSSWTLKWTFPSGQTVTQMWNGSYTQSGSGVTVSGVAWNSTIAPNATANVGFIGTWTGSNAAPTAFTLNGAACTIG
jgi:cellulase/cellobiase CelA1